MTLTTIARQTRFVGRKLLIGLTLTFIGLLVGIGCVLLPPMTPLGIVALAGLILLWVLPDLHSVPARWTRFMILPFVLSIQCIPVYYAIILPGMPWVSIRRLLLFALIGPLCIVLSGSSEAREYIRQRFGECKALTGCLLGLLFMMAISTPLGIRPFTSLSFNVELMSTVALPMLAIVLLVRDERAVLRLFALLTICVGIDLVLGTIEFTLKKPFLVYVLPASMREQFFAENPLAANSLVIGQGGNVFRASSTFGNALSWGEMAAMLAPIGFYYIAHGRAAIERSAGALCAVMCVAAIVMSGSRGANVAIIAAVLVFTTIWALRLLRLHPEKLGGKIWLTLNVMGSTVALLGITFVPRLHAMVFGDWSRQGSNDARWAQWELAKPKILASPLWGYGTGSSGDVIDYHGFGGPDTPPSVDSYILGLLVDYGIPGFFFFTAAFFIAIYICLHTYVYNPSKQATLGAALGSSLIAFVIYRITLAQWESLPMAFILIGLTVVYRHLTAGCTERGETTTGHEVRLAV